MKENYKEQNGCRNCQFSIWTYDQLYCGHGLENLLDVEKWQHLRGLDRCVDYWGICDLWLDEEASE